MSKLNTYQVLLIEDRLFTKYKIKYADFRNEIIDHMACEIEHEMDEGESFEDAYVKIRVNWNAKLISANKGFLKGIPQLVVAQLESEFKKVELKFRLIGIALAFSLAGSLSYMDLNLPLLYGLIPCLMGASILLTYQHVKEINDYRFDYFKGKAFFMLSQSIIIVLFLLLIYWLLDDYEGLTVYFEGIVLYSFLMNCYLLFKFRYYSKYSKMNVVF